MSESRFFVTALLGPPFGLNGLLRVKSLSGETAHIKKLKTVELRLGQKTALFKIEYFDEKNGDLLVKFEQINSPEEARLWRGAELLVPLEQAAPLKSNEFYIEDLKRLVLFSASGAELGVVRDVIEGGGGFLLEVELYGKKSEQTKLIPFRDVFIGDISIENKRAVLLAEWILE
ncbi:MAG: ribosome maturation factor RimM [Spirochaetaceae bacterium]|jgi:16S rRNA processing protein RimM|nr:ribosome maturation factor RimM [Spirochaetaceae bacterium]